LGNISEAKGQYKEALGYFKQHLIYKDSVFKKQYDVKMSAMNTLYELNTKETKISNLELQKKLQQEKIKELYILIAFIVLLLIIIILLIHRRNHRNEKKLREFFTEQQLKSQEDERQRISKDLHDSVGQNMLFIKNQLLQLQQPIPDLVMTSVEQALQEIRSISKELYPNQSDQYGLQSAVDVLCEKVRASSHVFISSELNIDRSVMNKELKINCYRIIQESITNALKHAAASAIRITGERIGNTLEFIVQDNGKGFDESIRSKLIHRSFGLLNIEERVRIMHGQLDIETGLNKGTKLKFQIPIV
jgi:signal transduction histidine kinase